MCLAIPMRITRLLPDGRAAVERDGLQAEVDVSLLENPEPGAYVIVHAGFALEVLDLAEAEERLQLFRRLADSSH